MPRLKVNCFFFVLLSAIAAAQQPPKATSEQVQPMPQESVESARKANFYRIDVDDSTEAVLIEQELGIKPEVIRGRSFFYRGNEQINKRLQEFGYQPVATDPEDILSRVVRIPRRGKEAALRDVGVTVILRERTYWVVRATAKQLRVLTRLGYGVQDLGKREVRPRQVSVRVSTASQVADVVAPRIDIYHVRPVEKGFVVRGAAFDYAIDELRDLGFVVTVEPDPPGVIR